jgi:hypothetical protein
VFASSLDAFALGNLRSNERRLAEVWTDGLELDDGVGTAG